MRKVLLVWNKFDEGNNYFLLDRTSRLAELAKACHGHYVNRVDVSEDIGKQLDELTELLFRFLVDRHRLAVEMPIVVICHPPDHYEIVAVYESGFIP